MNASWKIRYAGNLILWARPSGLSNACTRGGTKTVTPITEVMDQFPSMPLHRQVDRGNFPEPDFWTVNNFGVARDPTGIRTSQARLGDRRRLFTFKCDTLFGAGN